MLQRVFTYLEVDRSHIVLNEYTRYLVGCAVSIVWRQWVIGLCPCGCLGSRIELTNQVECSFIAYEAMLTIVVLASIVNQFLSNIYLILGLAISGSCGIEVVKHQCIVGR